MTRARENADLPVAMTESGGQVGIGATSVDQLLHLETSTNTRQKIETTNSGSVAGLQLTNTAITAEIGLETSSDAGGGAYANSIGGSSLHILNNNNSGIVMDTSGRVTMPFQPAFKVAWASRNATGQGSGLILSTNSGYTVQAGRDSYDVGNNFNAATGAFTAPVAGTYMFTFQFMRNGSNGSQMEVRLRKNGGSNSMWARAYRANYNTNHQSSSITTTTRLAANDYVTVFIGSNTSIYNDDTYFTGVLLG